MAVENRIPTAATVYHSDNHKLPLYSSGIRSRCDLDSWHVDDTSSQPFSGRLATPRRKLAVGDGKGPDLGSVQLLVQDTASMAGLMLGKNERLLLEHKRRMSGSGSLINFCIFIRVYPE